MRENDAISRSAVLEVGNVRQVTEYDKAGYYMTYNAVPVVVIEALPALDVAPVVHARWRYKVAYAVNARVTNIIYCTACGKGFHRIEGVNFNFCPNCGARTDGGVDV